MSAAQCWMLSALRSNAAHTLYINKEKRYSNAEALQRAVSRYHYPCYAFAVLLFLLPALLPLFMYMRVSNELAGTQQHLQQQQRIIEENNAREAQ